MQYSEREHLINKIVSGFTICNFNNIPVMVTEPSLKDKVKAGIIYSKEYRVAELNGMLRENQMMDILIQNGQWSKSEEDELNRMPKMIEELKVELYNSYFHFKRQEGVRKSLDSLKFREVELIRKREEYKSLTCEGFALASKNKFLICSSTKNMDGNNFFVDGYENYNQQDVDLFMKEYFSEKVDDSVIRELSKGEPWRSTWSAGKIEGSLFGMAASLLSPEQKMLIIWSKIYDSIYESPDCPPEEIINDNDCLDGWMIANSRKREQERKSEHGYKPGDKFAKHDEVFIMVENPDDVARVESMNSSSAIFRKQQRMNALQQSGGIIQDRDMPDAQQGMRQTLVQMQREHIHRGKR